MENLILGYVLNIEEEGQDTSNIVRVALVHVHNVVHVKPQSSGVTKGPADPAVRGGGRHLRGAPNRCLNMGQF